MRRIRGGPRTGRLQPGKPPTRHCVRPRRVRSLTRELVLWLCAPAADPNDASHEVFTGFGHGGSRTFANAEEAISVFFETALRPEPGPDGRTRAHRD